MKLFWGGVLLLAAASLATPWPLRAEIASVRFYRGHLSHYVGYVATCRYRPTCSRYALQHLESDGFWLGNLQIAQRLVMCSPVGFVIDTVRGTTPEWKAGPTHATARSRKTADSTATAN